MPRRRDISDPVGELAEAARVLKRTLRLTRMLRGDDHDVACGRLLEVGTKIVGAREAVEQILDWLEANTILSLAVDVEILPADAGWGDSDGGDAPRALLDPGATRMEESG